MENHMFVIEIPVKPNIHGDFPLPGSQMVPGPNDYQVIQGTGMQDSPKSWFQASQYGFVHEQCTRNDGFAMVFPRKASQLCGRLGSYLHWSPSFQGLDHPLNKHRRLRRLRSPVVVDAPLRSPCV